MDISTLSANFCIVDAAGRILRSGTCPADAIALQPLAFGERRYPYRAKPDIHYIDETGSLVERPILVPTLSKEQITADGADTALLTGLPSGACIKAVGMLHEAQDGQWEVRATKPGWIRLEILCWPYQDHRLSIQAV
ncbi:MAG: hypothetical protein WC378_04430 [Opitutaceae bacterium]|jgi:hypothetical protein